MKVLVCGSREWPDYHVLRKHLERLPRGSVILHGGARGGDLMAGVAARALGFEEKVFPADWKRYGKKAGFIRNLEMLEAWPDLVLAFSLNHSAGTEHTIREARKRGIPTRVIRYQIKDGSFESSLEEPEEIR